MTAKTIEKLTAQALKLPSKAKGKLVDRLLETMDEADDPRAEELWAKEIERRVKLDKQGKLKYVSAASVLKEIRNLKLK